MPARRFAPPWSVEEQSACFVVRTTTGSLVDDHSCHYFHSPTDGQRGASVRFCSTLGLLGVAWAMSACAENPSHLSTTYLDRYADPNPTLASILECHGFGCSETSRATLSRAPETRRQSAAR